MLELHLGRLATSDWQGKNEPADLVISRFPCVLGRSPTCDERIDDLMVSRCHCVFSCHEGRAWVEDLGSRNGTGLNGDRLTGVQPLVDGDILQVGNLAFQVRLRNAALEPDLLVAKEGAASS
jgi:pSer/pThr/pTyr-binding forkhead associated (FHA) protein